MAKNPFPFKPTKPISTQGNQRVELFGTPDVVASFSDVFVVLNEAETGMGSIYFYQRQLSDRDVVLGASDTMSIPRARCITRVVMSEPGIEKLLEALADNRGYTLTRKIEEKK